MPIYEFQCDACGLKFEEILPMSNQSTTHTCDCGAQAKKLISTFAFNFNFTPTGPVPQNTGVSSIDYNVDRIIGKDAEAKWKVIEKREAEKKQLLKNNPDKKKDDLRLAKDRTHYEVMKPQERDAILARREFSKKAVTALHERAVADVQKAQEKRKTKTP